MPEPYYATAEALRDELELDSTALPDDAATKLLENAEDVVDRLLGAWPANTTTGRKITEADVEPWQFAKLARATVKLAAKLHATPDLIEPGFSRVKGPDFEIEGPIGSRLGTEVLAPLEDSNLRRLAGRAQPGGTRSQFRTFFDARRHDGT